MPEEKQKGDKKVEGDKAAGKSSAAKEATAPSSGGKQKQVRPCAPGQGMCCGCGCERAMCVGGVWAGMRA